MKPATDAPAIGTVVETTTRRRIVSADQVQNEPTTPDLWEYLEEIEKKREWDKHIIYIYRIDPTPSVMVQKCQQYLTCPDNTQVPMWNQEEIEWAFLRFFGGKKFRVIVKRGAQLMTVGMFHVDAPPRSIAAMPADSGVTMPSSGGVTFGTADSTAQVANKAIDTIAGQEHQAVSIGVNALAAAANIVDRFAKGQGNGTGGPQDELQRALMQAMIARLAAPQPSFLEELAKIATAIGPIMAALKEIGIVGGAGAAGMPAGMLDKLLNAMFTKFMNPEPTGAPVSATAEIVRQAPSLISGFAEVIREQRLLMESQRPPIVQGTTANRGPNPQVIPPAVPTAPAPSPEQRGAPGAPTMEFIESKIVEILSQPVSAEQAADDAMNFLDSLDPPRADHPGAVDTLASLGEQGLLKFFHDRPTLRGATANIPRLVEFIRAFLKMHAEDKAKAGQEPPTTPGPN